MPLDILTTLLPLPIGVNPYFAWVAAANLDPPAWGRYLESDAQQAATHAGPRGQPAADHGSRDRRGDRGEREPGGPSADGSRVRPRDRDRDHRQRAAPAAPVPAPRAPRGRDGAR